MRAGVITTESPVVIGHTVRFLVPKTDEPVGDWRLPDFNDAGGNQPLPDSLKSSHRVGSQRFFDLEPDFGLPADALEAQRRLKFSQWLTDPRNPLPARVMANRIWHFHFGQGIVATANDFGVSSARPVIPRAASRCPDWHQPPPYRCAWSCSQWHPRLMESIISRSLMTDFPSP